MEQPREGARVDVPTVKYLMRTRTLIGEYESKVSVDGKPVPAGTARGYYPPILDEPTCFPLQSAMALRRQGTARGRVGVGVPNLFGNLLVSGDDGSRMWVLNKEQDRRLAPCNAINGNASGRSFPLDLFERHFLTWVREVQVDPPRQRGRPAG